MLAPNGHGAKFGRQKEAAIAALITHHGNLEKAAATVNISSRTLRRWMKCAEFQSEYRQAREDIVRQAQACLQQNAGAAAMVQLKLMADPTTPHAVRARTSQYVLETGKQLLATDQPQPGSRQVSQFQARLRGWARDWRVDEEAFLRAAAGHEEELRRELRDDGTVTWPTFELLRSIALQVGTERPAELPKKEST